MLIVTVERVVYLYVLSADCVSAVRVVYISMYIDIISLL